MTESSKPLVVLLHGLWMNGMECALLRQRLLHMGYPVKSFRYHSISRGLQSNTALFRDFLEDLSESRPHVVGHSLGGVVALQTETLFPGTIHGRVVCLGSPLLGSRAASQVASWEFGEAMVGRTIAEAVLESPLEASPSGIEVGVIAGTLAAGLGQVVTRFPGSSDGVVGLDETRLPGITDHYSLPVNHTGLVISPRVAEQVSHFLDHGRFRHAV